MQRHGWIHGRSSLRVEVEDKDAQALKPGNGAGTPPMTARSPSLRDVGALRATRRKL